MLDKCPDCGTPLINGRDGKQRIEYPPAKLQEFAAGLLSIEQLNEFAIIYYTRERLCPNAGNNDTFFNKDGGQPLHPPCKNYHGGDTSNPAVVVETIKMIDN